MPEGDGTKSKYFDITLHDIGYDQAVAQLPPSIRWVTILADREGLSPLEIADLAGVHLDVVVEVLERGQSLVRDVHHRMIAESKGVVHGNH
jgi:DNA-directed RNA polymerase specialized sigma24 family protein